jgi:hypothetical protein
METITIKGIRYNVRKAVTPEQADAEGHKATADMMRENSQARQLYMQRPAGKVIHFVVEYTSRHGLSYGNVVSLGNW